MGAAGHTPDELLNNLSFNLNMVYVIVVCRPRVTLIPCKLVLVAQRPHHEVLWLASVHTSDRSKPNMAASV